MSKNDSISYTRCLVCKRSPVDQAHIKTKKTGGPNEPFNLMPLCRICHRKQHDIGIISFMNRFPEVKKYLEDWGWEIIENGSYSKLWNPKLNTD